MAATHASIVKSVLRTLKALPDNASKTAIEAATEPLRELFKSLEGLPVAERRRKHRRITGMLSYRHLDRRHAKLTNQAAGLL